MGGLGNMKTMLKMFACGLEKTQTFCFIIKRMGWKLVESVITINVSFEINGNKG
jgi:hypothetical protein